ncbi:uracil-DNA glycosylase [Palleronia sp. THAF1]|uniref:uracil-DNA glycosylase n=1 Tax=Palleronia sp. THAF1 TaxID=2587842 RepID=UPI000F53D7A9|nr:uracil-DNA glycosylase [Palleronia sp. THAF1]
MDADSYHAALDALDWQIDLGADEAILDAPVNRYETAAAPKAKAAEAPTPVAAPEPSVEAQKAANAATDLDGLKAALAAFQGFEIRRGARNLVFSDGDSSARVMVIGEVPDRNEDREGKPFTGPAGQLFDRMFAAIDLSRDGGLYATCALPWRTPHDRAATPDELTMMRPFLLRHIELAAPDVLIIMGSTPAELLLGRAAISRLRGKWTEAAGKPALPMLHPAALLKTPEAKRDAWADLLSLKARL